MTLRTPHAHALDVAAVARGEASPARREALLAHLDEGCPQCEAAFEAAIDDDTLARLAAAETAAPVAAPKMRAPRRPFLLWTLAGLAMAAAVLLTVQPDPPDTRAKGTANAPVVSLQVAIAHERGGKLTVDHLALPGELVSRQSILLFEVEVDRAAARTLFTVDAAGHTSAIFPTLEGRIPVEPAGARRVASGAEWVAFDLSDQAGTVRFVAGASGEPIDSAALRAAWPSVDAGFGWDSTTVEVVP